MSSFTSRVAGAPITWGVCEVPGWGLQLSPERVLAEIAGLGLHAVERGPDGFLPRHPAELRAVLAAHELRLVAGFVPVVLHRPERLADELAEAERQAVSLAAAGAEVLVVAAATGEDGYDKVSELTDREWDQLVTGIGRISAMADRHGLATAVHPHYGTVVQTAEHVDRLLASTTVGLCLDTGHLLAGGADPVSVTHRATDRIRHVHLKDVDASLAARLRDGEVGYRDATAAGMYRSLGDGDVDVAAIVTHLEAHGYRGWYVLEQDTVLLTEPDREAGPTAAAAASLAFLEKVAAAWPGGEPERPGKRPGADPAAGAAGREEVRS